MIRKIVISSVLALSAVNALAGTYIQDSEGKQILLTNVGNNNNFGTYTEKVKITNSSNIYSTAKETNKRDVYVTSNEEINQAIEKLRAKANEYYKSENNTESHAIQSSYKSESHTDSNDYADSAYAALR